MAGKIPEQRKPGQRGGQRDSDWKGRKTLSAVEQAAQADKQRGGGTGGGGGGGSSKGGLCGIITLALLGIGTFIVGGATYGIAQLLG